jgi:ABC-type Zn uptake system ZnuABC Zn-binding protein ZnuA
LCDLSASMPKEQLFSHPDDPALVDPHVWMDPALWSRAVDPLVAALLKVQPAHAPEIETRGHSARFDLKKLAEQLQKLGASMPAGQRSFPTRNFGLRYLGRVIGITVQLGEPGTSNSARKLEALALDTLSPSSEKLIGRNESHDLSTYEGLVGYAADLMVVALR